MLPMLLNMAHNYYSDASKFYAVHRICRLADTSLPWSSLLPLIV